jgi:outer membrane protein
MALVIGMVAASSHGWAQELRIGFVNTDRVLREANTAKAAQTKLEQEFLKREKEVTDLGEAVKTMTEKLEREAPTLSDSQRATRQKQLVEQDRDFQRRRREFQEDLSARRNEELQQVLDRANKVIRQLAEAEKLDLIMQPDQVVYVNPKHDITDKVIKGLNAVGGK